MQNNTKLENGAHHIKKRLIGTKKLAEILDISINTVYFWVYTKQIPYYKVKNLVKFDILEIEKWINQKKVIPRNQVDLSAEI